MGMPANGPVIVRDAVMGLVTRSANDAAVLLAEALGGNEDSFARHDDPEGAPARHDLDRVPQRLGPAQPASR